MLVLLLIPSNASAQSCVGNPVAVQILGSGGPRVNPDRASSSYVLWIGAAPVSLALDAQLCTIAGTTADRKGALMIQFAIAFAAFGRAPS
jgi:hypothetical protein